MIIVYLKKLTVTNDVFLNDPTSHYVAPVVVEPPQIISGGPSRIVWRRDEIEKEDELIIMATMQFLGAA